MSRTIATRWGTIEQDDDGDCWLEGDVQVLDYGPLLGGEPDGDVFYLVTAEP